MASNIVKLGLEYFPQSSIGRPISNADIYVGIPDTNPETVGNQKQLSVLQEDGTIVAVDQPISTGAGGVPLYDGSPVTLLVDGDYSLKVNDSTGIQMYYIPNTSDQSLDPGNYYYPDYAAVDHGVTGDSDTIKYYVDLIGTTNKATIFLRHNSGNEFTDYVFSTAETIPSNITIKFEPGARLDPDTAIVVTINNSASIEASLNQHIFTGLGTISFGTGGTYSSAWWGDTGDGATDDYDALNAAFTALSSNTGGHLVIGPGTHLFDGDLVWTGNYTSVDCQGTLAYNSAGAGTAITIGEDASQVLGQSGNIRVIDNTGSNWGTAKIGIETINLYHCDLYFDIGGSGEGFDTGLKIVGSNTNGNSYNKYTLGLMWDLKIGVHTYASGGGWANENTVIGGRFSASAATIGVAIYTGSYHIKNENGNNNSYIRPSFEQGWYEYYFYSNDANTSLLFPRMESSAGGPTYNIFADVSAYYFSFIPSHFDTTDIAMTPENGYVNLTNHGWFHAVDRNMMRLPGGKSWYNTTSATVPTSGSYRKGDLLYQDDANFGQSLIKYCLSNGSYSTATDNTGDTDGSTAVITGMTDTSDFYVGEFVSVSAGFPAIVGGNYMQIIAKTATTITLDDDSDAAVDNVTVATVDPTWVEVVSAQLEGTLENITYAGEVTPDMAVGNIVQVDLTGNCKIMNPSNLSVGQKLYLYLDADGTNRDITFDTYFKATAFTLTANKRTVVEFIAVTSVILVQINSPVEND